MVFIQSKWDHKNLQKNIFIYQKVITFEFTSSLCIGPFPSYQFKETLKKISKSKFNIH
jgi:hypothetical protein